MKMDLTSMKLQWGNFYIKGIYRPPVVNEYLSVPH